MSYIGKQVKVIKIDVARYGEIGRVIGKELTPIGMMYRVEFEDGVGLYRQDNLRIIE